MKLLLITPAYNEAAYLEVLIKSICAQTHLPAQWLIVDDGSTDETPDIVRRYMADHPWIKLVQNTKKEKRASGAKVVRAFYLGFDQKDVADYEVVAKIDADLKFPPNYFEEIIRVFQTAPQVGMCGGVCTVKEKDTIIVERVSALDHIRGALKTYRRACFEDIGGLKSVLGWDSLDEYSARFHNWEVKVLPDLHVFHFRDTNTEDGFLKMAAKNGRMLYQMRMGLGLTLANGAKRAIRKPYLSGGAYLMMGYLKGLWGKDPKIVSEELGAFIRKYRYKKIKEKLLG